jgi:parallel beta-helix repeat protein
MKYSHFRKWNKLISFLISFAFLLSICNGFQLQLFASNQTIKPDSNKISAYVSHDPILISNNGNFTDYGFAGSGTEISPYIIENYEIITEEYTAIEIIDVTAYFVIQHCHLEADSIGINIENAAQGTATVFNNTCMFNFQYGISVEYSEGSAVINNTVDGSHRGIHAYHAELSTIENNTVMNCDYGLYIVFTDPITIKNNFLYNCGIYITDSESSYPFYTLENNYVNDKPVGYFVNIDEITFEDPIYGQLIFISCSDITIKNQVLNNANFGLLVKYSDNIHIINNTVKSNTNGISLYLTHHTELINNTIEDGGIFVQNSDYVTIRNNYFFENYYASNILYCLSPIIESNLFVDNTRAIFFQYTDNAIIQNNTCKNNGYITNSYGIYLHSSSSAVIKLNIIEYFINYGLSFVSSSENNIVFLNRFINNNPSGASQASDDGTNNSWYSPLMLVGNYWDDLLGSDNYTIDGTAGSIDLFPIIEIDLPPVINHPDDVEYEEGTDENTISWEVYDLDPSIYIIYLNDLEVERSSWVFLNEITINIDSLPAGTHNYTIVVNDSNGNMVTDAVFVTVIPSVGEFRASGTLLFLLAITTLIIPIVIMRKRKK